jgi:hypothetical protein
LEKQEYVDSKSGISMPLHAAIRKKKIKIVETRNKILNNSRISLKDTSFAFSDVSEASNIKQK